SGIPLGDFSSESIDLISEFNKNISTTFLKSLATDADSFHTFNEIILFITELKCRYELEVKKVPLSKLKNWVIDDYTIHHAENKYFEIIATNIQIGNREVVNWSQ